MRRTLLMMAAALAVAAGCRASAGDRREPSDRRPSDFGLQLRFVHGSGMQPPVELRVDGSTLILDGAPMRTALTSADLDAIYEAARRLPPSASRPPPEQESDRSRLQITVVAAGARFSVDSDTHAIDPADDALLDMLQARAAAALASPIALAAKRPGDFTLEVCSGPSQRDARILSVTGDLVTARHWGPDTNVSHSAQATDAELDALYAAARVVAAAGLPPQRATGGRMISIQVVASGLRFESQVDIDSVDAGARARVESLRAVADALFDRVDR